MKLLILLIISPSVIIAQRYHNVNPSSSNPNDEPFLPIYPIYPYNPKLIKRGTERDIAGQLTPELYAPKLDARDPYSATYNGNYQRDPYYPTYNPYPKSSPSLTAYPGSTTLPNNAYTSPVYSTAPGSFAPTNSYANPSTAPTYNTQTSVYGTPNNYSPYGTAYSNPYAYTPSPYGVYNSYPASYAGAPNPYQTNPYATGSYPNYNYQAPYYYPNYYNQPYPPLPPPPPPPSSPDYPENSDSDDSAENETPGKSSGGKKSETRKNRLKDNDSDNADETKDGQFVDGGNYLSSGSKDLDGQPSTYKTPSTYNALEQSPETQRLRSVPLPGVPRTTYRVISVGGQPVGPDYPLPSTYAKVQQLEHIMSQTLAKLLAQNAAAQQAAQSNYQLQNNNNGDSNSGNYGGTNKPRNVIAKTGLAYVMNSDNVGKIGNNGGQYYGNFGDRQTPLVIKVQNPGHVVQQGSTVLSKAAGKYVGTNYGPKPVTTVNLQQSPGVYIPPEAKDAKDETSGQTSEYGDYDAQSSQNYDGSVANSGSYVKNDGNYSLDPYHSSNLVTVQTPQAQSYQYSSYLPTQSTQQQQQSRDYKTGMDNVNFGNKRTGKE